MEEAWKTPSLNSPSGTETRCWILGPLMLPRLHTSCGRNVHGNWEFFASVFHRRRVEGLSDHCEEMGKCSSADACTRTQDTWKGPTGNCCTTPEQPSKHPGNSASEKTLVTNQFIRGFLVCCCIQCEGTEAFLVAQRCSRPPGRRKDKRDMPSGRKEPGSFTGWDGASRRCRSGGSPLEAPRRTAAKVEMLPNNPAEQRSNDWECFVAGRVVRDL